MPPIGIGPPYPALAAFAAVGSALFLFLAIRAWRRARGRRTIAFSLALALVLAATTGVLAVASYHEYVRMNTWTYFYELDVQPNDTSPEVLIVPVPEDASLLATLHVVSGEANWSLTDTLHGRGLYVLFQDSFEIGALMSEFAPSGPSYNTALTMTNSSNLPTSVWIFYSGSGASFHFQPGGLVTYGGDLGDEILVAGWHLHTLLPPPMPP